MTDPYNPQEIEPRWQKRWESDQLYRAVVDWNRPKYYALTMLPYPSGDLHMGHWYAMAPSDARARYMRMKGYNVLFPMGFDAFGLPAENAAIQRNVHPKKWTYANIEKMRQQLRSMGAMFDWEREAVSSDPSYYKWSQWFFLQLYQHGLAYRAMGAVDFCPHCNTTLAREQVWGEDRHCERCGTPVIKKNLEQWYFRTTRYADELLDHSRIDWPERVETMQKNWIGRSEGAHVVFHSEDGEPIEVFTTRPDTLWGATFMVLAPEHPLVETVTTDEQRADVEAYVAETARKDEIDRTAEGKEKTGVFTGGYAINPVNGARIPIWIADYVLMTYGSGAIMAVPAHDERDFAFALKFGLPIIPVIDRPDGLTRSYTRVGAWMKKGFTGALDRAGIPYETEGDHVYVTLHARQADAYIAIAQEYLQSGAWCEVVGGRWVFIFEDGVVPFDSVEADRQIMARCRALEPAVAGQRTVMEMLYGLEWYHDALYHDGYGDMINSGPFSGTKGTEEGPDGEKPVAKAEVTAWLEKEGIGHFAVNYRLRDWVISRQRYWGAPIPMVYCPECGIVPVPEEELPVLLPDDVQFMPTGESPLKFHEGFRYTTCPGCGGEAERETDTMDTFMCSSWYQYRYLSPRYDDAPFDPAEAAYWLPVDQYTGGIEHATMHLMYTRFFTKAMRDFGAFEDTKRIMAQHGRKTDGLFDEPMAALFNQGMILGEDREKMSKSRGNVIAPDDLVQQYGADTVRGYLMQAFKWDQGGPWDSQGIQGVVRWLKETWALFTEPLEVSGEATGEQIMALRRKVHQTIRQVTDDLENFKFNTAISALMTLKNAMQDARKTPVVHTAAWDEARHITLRLMAPFTPHIAEELWARSGYEYSVHTQPWPGYDEAIAAEEQITLIVQVNGKVRDRIQVPADISEAAAKEAALNSPAAQRHMSGKKPKKVIYIAGRGMVNIVV